MRIRLILLFFSYSIISSAQGLNSQWLLGYYPLSYQKARILFGANSDTLIHEYRKMSFNGTQASICDANGNFLMSSNGVWIANSSNDTMANGSGLNPGPEVNAYPDGLYDIYNNVFLPFPGDSNRFVLFHHVMDTDANSFSGFEIFRSIIDISLDSVILKNDSVLSDTINEGFAACKHANGRDWWVVCQKQRSDILITMLLTPSGITNISYQSLGMPIARFNVTQLTFSQDGTKLAYNRYDPTTVDESVILADFDRCTGLFSNAQNIPITINDAVWGLAFSSNGKFVYACSSTNIFQIETTNLIVDTVAVFDGFSSPFPPFYTTFFNMYLAANSKIYITSGNSTSHLHFINYPDSSGIACDVQQHALSIDSVRHFRAVPNHPNYYLGPVVGSICDSLGLSIQEINYNFRFRIYPNPILNNTLNIVYSLPQNKSGLFQIYDINGRVVFKYILPPWSNEQSFKLPELSGGIYNCIITSGNARVSKKIAIINE
jgi:hypothetical protein